MLNGDLKKNAIAQFEATKSAYEHLGQKVGLQSEKLMNLRKNDAHNIITRIEALFSGIANKPKEFDKTFSEYKAEFKVFNDILDKIKENARQIDIQAGGTAGTGVAAGAGVVAFAPTAAMAIATTFGTASTGTAISALGGAAATNAALAWLGGGALAAGGGGMAAGNALLALAGPVGWAIGGTALVGSALFARSRNEKIAKEADEKRKEIEVLNRQFKAASLEVQKLTQETQKHIMGMQYQLRTLDSTLTTLNYNQLDGGQKALMISLKNHVESLCLLMKKKVEL
ncbi:hypothetical protein [Acinetobacter towneri]|uniref:hypothetical protein n=1 Tax=Acinetobacter towneri TaxID=202956 RepID=UPI003A83D60A